MRFLNCLGLFAFLLLTAQSAPPAPIDGHWEGTLVREGASLPVTFEFGRDGAALTARFNSPTQRALGIPLRNVRAERDSVHFELVGDATTIVFDGRIAGDRLAGDFREGAAGGTFALRRFVPAPPPYREEEVQFVSGDATLSGTLLVPRGGGRHPVILFIQGSGAESRAASRFLADHMARNGIAALIYDKRGVGRSTGNWRAADFGVLAGDAVAGIELLAARPDIAGDAIGLYGHSQGGTIGPLIAARTTRLAFLISAAGGAVPMREAEAHSLANQLHARGITGDELAAAQRFIARLVDVASTGEGWAEFEAESERVRNERWYPMLRVPPRDNWFWSFYRNIGSFDAGAFWPRVTMPVLVVYGERDIIVPVERSIANIGRALGRVGNTQHLVVMLPRADHGLNVQPIAGGPFEWSRLAPGYPDLLVAWVRNVLRNRAGR